MRIFLGICGIILSFLMIKYREQTTELFGEPEWVRKIGGIYMIVILLAVFLFFWSIAAITRTEDIFLWPLVFFIPGAVRPDSLPPPSL